MDYGKLRSGASMTKKVFCIFTGILFLLSLVSCDMWYQDWKGYMAHWTGTVKVADVQWTSHPESQTNASGQITIPTTGTISTTINISNPENYTLNLLPGSSHVGSENEALKSVQVYGDAGNWVRPRTEIVSSTSTGFELRIHPISFVSSELSRALEHTDFTIKIIPCRSDSGSPAANYHNIAFRYNTPPRTIREVVVVKADSGAYEYDWLGAIPQMKAVDENTPLWEATAKTGNTEMDDYLFWAWPKNNTGKTDPDYIEKFQVQIDSGDYIDLALEACVVPGNPLLLGDDGNLYTIYRYKVGSGSNLSVRAVDGEGVAGQALSSGVAPYLITINPTEGSVNGSQAETTIYKSGGALITSLDLPNPIHSNDEYVLAGWATSPDGVAVSFPYTITEAVTFYALWQQKEEEVLPPSAGDSGTGSSGSGSEGSVITYIITYEGNGSSGGDVPTSQIKTSGQAILIANKDGLERTGYAFTGWNTQPDGSGVSYAEGDKYTSDSNVILYAQWKTIDYTISYDLDEGNNNKNPYGYSANDLPIVLNEPSKTGYTFLGWIKDGSPVTQIVSGTTGNITLTAQWRSNKYTVKFAANDGSGSMTEQGFTYDQTQNLATNSFERSGYIFVGWNTMADGSGTSYQNLQEVVNLSATDGDIITLYAQWKINSSISGNAPVIADPTDLFTVNRTIDDITFTVKDGYTNPRWYVNGIEQVSGGNVFNITYRDKAEGVYQVMLLVDGANGTPYSAQYQLEIAIPKLAADGKTYEFSTAAHFQWLAEKVKSGDAIEVKLTTDIVVPSGTWTPIYIRDKFVVHLDGQGHSITINEDYSDKVGDTSHYGVFENCNYSTIENLVLKGSLKVNTTGAVGAVSGYMFASTLRNIMSEMTITNLKGNVMNTSHTGTGGLVGYFGGNGDNKDSVIENCAVYADVTTQGDGGGLVGLTWRGATPFTIKNSLYKGNVSAGSAGAVMGFNGNDNRRTSTLSDIFYYEKDSLPILGGTNGGGLNQTNVTAVTEDKFKEQATADLVNGGQSPAKWILGANYPVLKQ